MALKKYILTIEFDDSGDNCEYIQEEFVDDTPEETKIIYVVIELQKGQVELHAEPVIWISLSSTLSLMCDFYYAEESREDVDLFVRVLLG